MNTRKGQLVLSLLISLLFIGCQQRQQGISHIKIGKDNEQKGYVGQQLLISADLRSEEALQHVEIAISSDTETGWEFAETLQEDIKGKNNLKFSTEVAVPISAKPGKYILIMKAIKSNGTVYQESESFTIAVDSSLPVISDLDIGLNATKNDLHLGAELTAAKKIKQIKISIQGEAWDKEIVFNGAKVEGKVSLHFHEHVHVDDAPEGAYDVVITVEDQDGRTASNQGTFTK